MTEDKLRLSEDLGRPMSDKRLLSMIHEMVEDVERKWDGASVEERTWALAWPLKRLVDDFYRRQLSLEIYAPGGGQERND
jgi:hypothetical protein